MTQPLSELMEFSRLVAKEAGSLLIAGFRTRPRVEHKGPVDLVTEWDRRSEALIRRRLEELCPGVPIVGEETGGTLSERLTFYCDPLDGTTNFVHGHPFFAVSIGVMENGIPLAGAVFAPILNWCWSGSRDNGAFRNDEPCYVSQTTRLGDSLLATGFPFVRDRAPHNNLDAYVRTKPKVRGIRRCGCASIDLCFVADGTYDGYWERALHAWDLVGGGAVLLAAGGKITALDGSKARLEIGHFIASNTVLHDALLDAVGENPMQLP
jgi:myo-inositol-1(or 4)-monophosphatase